MCALDLGLRWSARPRAVNQSKVFDVVISGAIVGVVSTAAFGIVHALAIVPIWAQLARGVVPAVLAGMALASAFDHFARVRGSDSVSQGAAFGLVMFTTLAPATVFSNALRLAGLRANDWPGALASVALAIASGAIAGWLLTRERTGANVFARAAFVLTLASSGPVPVVNGPRAAWLFVGFIPICVVAGITLSAARRLLRSTR